MPRKGLAKKSAKIAKKSREGISSEVVYEAYDPSKSLSGKLRNFKPSKKFLIAAVAIGLLALAYTNKGLFLAATVNGEPITALELSQKLHTNYKQRVLSQMIDQKLIEQEATKKGVAVNNQEVENKLSETENTYGGREVFESLLAQQGLTRANLAQDIKLQLLVEKMYTSEITPTDEEIAKFMEENKEVPEATDEAKFRQTAEQSVRQQKLVQIFTQKFQEIKSQANIQTF